MRTRTLALFLLAAALTAAPARGQALGNDSTRTQAEQKLFHELDPYYAADFLKDAAAQDALRRADPDAAARLVERAARLKDLQELLDAHSEAASLNEALRERLGGDADDADPAALDFARQPSRLVAWRARYGSLGGGAGAGVLAAAVWEWATLTPEQRKWLEGPPEPVTDAAWLRLSFAQRQRYLSQWGTALYDGMMKSSPKTRAELDQLKSTRHDIWEVMDGQQKRSSGEFMGQAEAAVEGLERLKSLPRGVLDGADPQVRSLLAEARSGATPEAVLEALNKLFDKAAVHDDAVQIHAPERAEQKLSSIDPKLLAEMLATGLRAEIRDVPEGLRVDRFFASHPLVVRARNLGTELAHFEPWNGEMVFNERFLNDWIKAQGLTAQDVVRSPARFHELLMILAPVFVHESTHQIQQDWASSQGLPWWEAQHQEIEADEAEFDYVLSKEAASPAYREFLKREIDRSYYVQQTVAQAEVLRRDPREFVHKIMSDYYAGLVSLDQLAAGKLADAERDLDALRAERSRSPNPAAFDARIAGKEAERDYALKTYRLSREREDASLARLDREIADALNPGKDATAAAPPPPGRPRR